MSSPADMLRLVRPKQWAKGVFVLVGPLYGLAESAATWRELLPPTLVAFVIFALASSACYIVNDVVDAPGDRLHPRKRSRPIASGAVSPARGLTLASVLLLAAGGLHTAIAPGPRLWLGIIAFLYVANTMLYSLHLKKRVIVDVMSLSLGFVLRVLGGCAAAAVAPSTWLLNCTLFIAMFLAFGKRLGERRTLGEEAVAARSVQAVYTSELLRMAVVVTAVATLVTYAGYVQFREATHRIALPGLGVLVNPLWLTMIPATYALLRSIVLLERGVYDDPTELATRDWPMQAAAGLFALITLWVLWVHLGASGAGAVVQAIC